MLAILIISLGIVLLTAWVFNSKLPAQEGSELWIVTDLPSGEKGSFTEVIGQIDLAGTAPRPYVILETKDGAVYVMLGEKARELLKFQYKTVHVTGYIREKVLGTGKGIEVVHYELVSEE